MKRNLNLGIYDRMMRLNLRIGMLERAIGVEMNRRLSAAVVEIRTKLVSGGYPGPYQTTASLATDDLVAALISVRSWFFDQLKKAATDIHRQIPYLLTGRRPKTESIDGFYFFEEEKDEEEEDELLDTLLLLLRQLSLSEIYLYMLEQWKWKGFTILQQWENLILTQRRAIFTALVQSASSVRATEFDYSVDRQALLAMSEELRRKVIGTGGPQTTLAIASALAGADLIDVTHKMVSLTASLNPAYFDGERWHSVLEPATCARCANLHGRWYPFKNGESTAPPNPFHFHCKCSLVPELRGYAPVPTEKFQEWLMRQPVEFQKNWLGATRYELLKSGRAKLRDFVEFRNGVPVRQFNLGELS